MISMGHLIHFFQIRFVFSLLSFNITAAHRSRNFCFENWVLVNTQVTWATNGVKTLVSALTSLGVFPLNWRLGFTVSKCLLCNLSLAELAFVVLIFLLLIQWVWNKFLVCSPTHIVDVPRNDGVHVQRCVLSFVTFLSLFV